MKLEKVTKEELLDIIIELMDQACYNVSRNEIDTSYLSAYERAADLLKELGFYQEIIESRIYIPNNNRIKELIEKNDTKFRE